MAQEFCPTCKYVVRDVNKQYWCAFNPPQVIYAPSVEGGPPVPQSSFPPVNPNWFCGQHKPKLVIATGLKTN